MGAQQFYHSEKVEFEQYSLVSGWIENIALQYPDHPAVTCGTSTINYKYLNETANQMAHCLIAEEHIVSGDLIGIHFTPSIDFIISLLAVIKAGAAYVPLDLTYPDQFLDFVIHDACPKIILTNTERCFLNTKTLHVKKMHIEKYAATTPIISLTIESPIYVMYTSGSTGQPKGVVIPHRAVVNHMVWICAEFQFKTTDKILLKTPLAFDPSIWEIFAPLFVGAELVIAPIGSHIDTQLLLTSILQHQITIVQFVPLLLQAFLNHPETANCLSLRNVFVGGESLPAETKKLFFSKLNCPLINLYGPTETTIDVLYHVIKNVPKEWEKNYIGKPIYNAELRILDQNEKPCVMGEIGELYIGGASVGLGYLNRADLTKNSFVDHPEYLDKKMYKTGDFVRREENGLIEYICRKDKQIKINGTRIELESLTSKIMAQEGIAHCIIEKNTESSMYAYLVCYIVSENNSAIDMENLKRDLSAFFPKAVIPREFYLVEKLPALPSGKIDMHTLRKTALLMKDKENAASNGMPIYLDLLEQCRRFTNNSMLDMHDLLYEGGMDSLFGLLLMGQIEKKYHIKLMIHEILSAKTIHDLADLITKKTKHTESDFIHNNIVITLKESGHKIPVFLIHPIGGTVFWYTHMAKHFPADRPLYAIQDPGIESDNYFFNSLEEMAHFYFTRIKEIQPSGPYIIGGASFGATVAIEMCRQLHKDEVITIPVLDGWAIYPDNLKDKAYFRRSMLEQQKDWSRKFDAQGCYDFKKIFATQRHRLELLYAYTMREIKHDIVLFKAKEIMEVFIPIDAPDNGWSKYTRGNLDIINVEGNHETIFQNDHVKNISNKLVHLLGRVINSLH